MKTIDLAGEQLVRQFHEMARKSDETLGLTRKSLDIELKSVEDDGSFVMYAAAFGNVDRGGDIIEPGAFINLDEFLRDGWAALNHRQNDLAVGYITAATQDAKGLRVEGKFHGTPEAQAVRTVVTERFRAGKAVKASIGYQAVKARTAVVDGEPVRRLEQVRLYEVSFVNLPMNPQADVVSAKSGAAPPPKGQPMATDTDPESKGLLTALKELLGLSKKAVEGGKMSKAGMTRLKAFAEEIHEHGEATREHAKAMHEHGKAAQACAKEMKAFIKAYDPDAEGDDDDDDEEQDEEPKPKKKKGKKAEEPEDTSDADPPKSSDRHDIAVKLALLRPPTE